MSRDRDLYEIEKLAQQLFPSSMGAQRQVPLQLSFSAPSRAFNERETFQLQQALQRHGHAFSHPRILPGGAEQLSARVTSESAYSLLDSEARIFRNYADILRPLSGKGIYFSDFGQGDAQKAANYFSTVGAIPDHYHGCDNADGANLLAAETLKSIKGLKRFELESTNFQKRPFFEMSRRWTKPELMGLVHTVVDFGFGSGNHIPAATAQYLGYLVPRLRRATPTREADHFLWTTNNSENKQDNEERYNTLAMAQFCLSGLHHACILRNVESPLLREDASEHPLFEYYARYDRVEPRVNFILRATRRERLFFMSEVLTPEISIGPFDKRRVVAILEAGEEINCGFAYCIPERQQKEMILKSRAKITHQLNDRGPSGRDNINLWHLTNG